MTAIYTFVQAHVPDEWRLWVTTFLVAAIIFVAMTISLFAISRWRSNKGFLERVTVARTQVLARLREMVPAGSAGTPGPCSSASLGPLLEGIEKDLDKANKHGGRRRIDCGQPALLAAECELQHVQGTIADRLNAHLDLLSARTEVAKDLRRAVSRRRNSNARKILGSPGVVSMRARVFINGSRSFFDYINGAGATAAQAPAVIFSLEEIEKKRSELETQWNELRDAANSADMGRVCSHRTGAMRRIIVKDGDRMDSGKKFLFALSQETDGSVETVQWTVGQTSTCVAAPELEFDTPGLKLIRATLYREVCGEVKSSDVYRVVSVVPKEFGQKYPDREIAPTMAAPDIFITSIGTAFSTAVFIVLDFVARPTSDTPVIEILLWATLFGWTFSRHVMSNRL